MKFMKKGKKLNNKGFTLIELLAVVVILALLMSISVTSVLTAMNNSRESSLWSEAKAVASWYNETVAQDELSSTKTIDVTTVGVLASDTTGKWYSLGTKIGTGTTVLATAYGLSESDFNVTKGSTTTSCTALNSTANISASNVTPNTCSSIRNNKGTIEVLIVAKNTGKFYVAKYSKTGTFALSSQDAACKGSDGTTICKNS